MVTFDEIKENDFNLNIPLYVEPVIEEEEISLEEAFRDFKNACGREFSCRGEIESSSYKGGTDVMSISQKELESYLWGAAELLRGNMDAGEYKQFIFPLLFYKRVCDVYDEEYEIALEESDGDIEYAKFAENHRFQIPEGVHWNDVREVTKNVGNSLQKAMRGIEKANPEVLYGIFGDAQWTNKERLSDETLRDLIEHFSSTRLTLEEVPQDKFGEAYEYLIKKFADDSGHTAAEFYTNRTLVELMTLIMDPQPGESVYDLYLRFRGNASCLCFAVKGAG